MDSKKTPIKLHIPSPSRQKLSFCQANVEGITSWASNLPMANTGEAARQLYLAIRELNQLVVDPVTRFKLLEVIRPDIYSIEILLAKHFLQTSVSLNERQLKIANLSQSLQTHLAIGYKLVVTHGIDSLSSKDKASKIITAAIHRAITDTTSTILRAFQLYCQPPEHSWSEINQLFLLAEMHKVEKYNISDTQNHYLSTSNITAAFVRAHLLGTAKPNNLRQQDLALLYDATELWADKVTVTDSEDESALFIVNLSRDRVAQYRQYIQDEQKASFRGLNTEALVLELKTYAANPEGPSGITVPGKLSDNLLSHSTQAWGIHWQRSFRRLSSVGQLSLCIGMSATHFYVAGKKGFDQVQFDLRPKLSDEKLQVDTGKSSTNDIWGESVGNPSHQGGAQPIDFVGNFGSFEEDENEASKYPIHDVTLINTSPGGYCLQWQGDLPASIQAGEILGIQASGVRYWAIGVIRWIRHMGDKSVQLGIELIAPKAEAAAAQLLQKTGANGTYTRALLLPAIEIISQPATLILPRMPFRSGNKINLLHNEMTGRQQLTQRIISTNSFSQFQFRSNSTKPAPIPAESNNITNNDDFDSLWNKL